MEEKRNERSVICFCVERGLCMSNTSFEHKSLHKYTWVDGGEDGVEILSTTDRVMVKRDMLCYVQDGRAVKGMG